MTANRHVKYLEALATARAEGWRFTTDEPRLDILYHALLLSGFKWNFVDMKWVKWREPFVIQKEAV